MSELLVEGGHWAGVDSMRCVIPAIREPTIENSVNE